MRRLLLLLPAVILALALNVGMTKASTFFTWDSSNGLAGTYTEVCLAASPTCNFNGRISTWSGTLYFDTTFGTEGSPPPISTLGFVGVQGGGTSPANLSFANLDGGNSTCSNTAGCAALASAGFLPFSSTPAGTSFELKLCDDSCTLNNVGYVILDVKANGGATGIVGFTGGTVIGGTEFGGSCTIHNNPSSDVTCADFINSTPLPATLPLLGTGLFGLWACIRRRKAQPKASFKMTAA